MACAIQTPVKTPKSNRTQCDRFIPNRSAMDLDVAHYNVMNENDSAGGNSHHPSSNTNINEIVSPSKEEYTKHLAENLLSDQNGSTPASKILAFKNKAPAPPPGFENPMKALYTSNTAGHIKSKRQVRHIPQAPERILDAPELLDDYYLNLLDWSSNNVVAVALGPAVYLWNADSGDIQQLMETPDDDDYVTSLQWAADGKHIAVGTNSAETQIWDAERCRQIRRLKGHAARVSCVAWNNTTLSTGGRDHHILNHDVRIRDHLTSTLKAHEQEVCGLKWSPSGQQLASGGNDNLLHIWDVSGMSNNGKYLHRLDAHQAAVKALAWCPFQSNLLASGGGTADRCIKFWNTNTGALLNSIDTHSQVCSLQWNKHERELLSSHGFSQNQLCLWKYPTMVKMAEFTGHSARVLHMAQSPDGYSVVSAAADETLRFWRCFGNPTDSVAKKAGEEKSFLRTIKIR